jgi:hypothetical protein
LNVFSFYFMQEDIIIFSSVTVQRLDTVCMDLFL